METQLAEDDYIKQDQYPILEEDYTLAKTKILDRLKTFRTPEATAATGASSQAASVDHSSIPKSSVPKFNGKQSEWGSFKELFCLVIKDKTNITPVVKLQHLMNNVEGEAKNRLKGMEMIGSNLEVA